MSEQLGKASGRDGVVLPSIDLCGPSPEEGLRLIEAFRAIDCAATRARVIQLVESMSSKMDALGSA